MRFARASVFAAVVLFAGCGGGGTDVDGGGGDSSTTPDAGNVDCTGMADGTSCGAGHVCVGGACVEGGCGDMIVDTAAGEQCDDGNSTAFDGCEPGSCTFTCASDGECDDGSFCNGTETCSVSNHVCQLGEPPTSGTPCTRTGASDGVCRGTGLAATCVDAGCGNGVTDGTEQCDDMNDVTGDGCEPDCTFTCESDVDCDDGTVCTGMDRCNSANHRCEASPPLDCDDGSACTDDGCDAVDGCFHHLIDGDGDGRASTDLGACGDDCDDADPLTYPGATELCEASPTPPKDNDCDPATPNPTASLWFLDCDEDGFSIVGAPSTMSCAMPPAQGGCGWTTRVPVSGDTTTWDCNDANGNMFPGQTMYFTSQHSSGSTDDERFGNYNCNGVAQMDHSTANNADSTDVCTPTSLLGRVSCSGSSGWVTTSTVGCGFSGTFTSCNAPTACTGSRCALTRGCGLVCTATRTTCTETSGCTPGTRDCPWAYYCCGRTTDPSARMGCR